MFWKEIGYLSKSDRRAIMTLLVLAVLIVITVYALGFIGKESNPIPAQTTSRQQSQNITSKNSSAQTSEAARPHQELFYFDPNTADSTQLIRLGLQAWQVRNIYKYRAKGGIYRTKEDFAYVYGLTAGQYHRLAPYIKISNEYKPASSLAEVRNHNRYDNYGKKYYSERKEIADTKSEKPTTYSPKLKKGEHININASDTTLLKTIPGIGSYYARQTMRYRNQLGGFVSKQQLLEIEDFPEEALQYIHIDKDNIHKLNVNKMSLSRLKRHPYINYYQARAITDYRRLHGEIKDIKELKLMKEFTEFDLNRIEPYIEY